MRVGIIKFGSCISDSMRIDPTYFLSEAVKIRKSLFNAPNGLVLVKECADKIFWGNIFTRNYVEDAAHGVPYLAASDTVLADLDTGVFLSRRQAKELSYLKLEKNWIVITCSGTIGNVTYTNEDFENRIATQDLIRIVPNDKENLRGVVSAFLTSKYGYYQLIQSCYGGVIKHISPDHVKEILIPKFSSNFSVEIDDMVRKAAGLRVLATKAKKSSYAILERALGNVEKIQMSSHTVSVSQVLSLLNKRLEGRYYVSKNRAIEEYVKLHFEYKLLKDCCERIFKPNIFKRAYVEKGGCSLLGGADIMDACPRSSKMISRSQVCKMPSLSLERGWILVSRAGTIGNTMYVDKQLCGNIISEDVLRVVPNSSLPSGYIYAYLTSKYGAQNIRLYTYGSVIQHIEVEHLGNVPIPILDDKIIHEVNDLMMSHIEYIERAKKLESGAVKKIEEEIESWSK